MRNGKIAIGIAVGLAAGATIGSAMEIAPAAGQVFVAPDADFLSDPRLSGANVRR